jgi:hypothetical protein
VITAAVFRPGARDFVLEEINTDLHSMQKILGGLIEKVVIAPGIRMWVGEEAKLQGRPKSVVWRFKGVPYIVLYGNVILTGAELVSISEKRLKMAKKIIQPIV